MPKRKTPPAGPKSNSIPPELVLEHCRAIKDAERDAAEADERRKAVAAEATAAKQKVKQLRETAKAAGVNVESLKLKEAIEGLPPADAVKLITDAMNYASYMNTPLFGYIQTAAQAERPSPNPEAVEVHLEWQSKGEGRKAGLAGHPRTDNPNAEPGSMKYVAWDRGWLEGDQERQTAEDMGGNAGIKTPSARRNRGKDADGEAA
jgi:hypothetical protein